MPLFRSPTPPTPPRFRDPVSVESSDDEVELLEVTPARPKKTMDCGAVAEAEDEDVVPIVPAAVISERAALERERIARQAALKRRREDEENIDYTASQTSGAGPSNYRERFEDAVKPQRPTKIMSVPTARGASKVLTLSFSKTSSGRSKVVDLTSLQGSGSSVDVPRPYTTNQTFWDSDLRRTPSALNRWPSFSLADIIGKAGPIFPRPLEPS